MTDKWIAMCYRDCYDSHVHSTLSAKESCCFDCPSVMKLMIMRLNLRVVVSMAIFENKSILCPGPTSLLMLNASVLSQ